MNIISKTLWLMLISSTAFAQANGYFVKTKEDYHYLVGTAAPDSAWKRIDFVDDSWLVGHHNIGYGNPNDSTVIQKATSVFIRMDFVIDTAPSIFKEASLLADFDDGYVAYLNGVEIARVNLGKKGEPVAYNQLADRSRDIIAGRRTNHEAINPLKGYYIDSTLLHATLRRGKNVLAIEVHNDSINGSDLSFSNFSFSDITSVLVTPYSDQWHIMGQLELDSSYLPIISVETGEYGVVNGDRVMAKMKIINNKSGVNRIADTAELSCDIGIKLRGNSTIDWPKKNYAVETRNPDSSNLDVSVLGMPPENDWVLNGPWADKSQIRNALSMELGSMIMKGWTPRTRYCELIINGEYHGVYLVMESIKRDSNRVDIKKLKAKDTTGVDLTGGYIIKYDQGGFKMVYPEDEDIKPAQLAYANKIYADFVAAAKSTSFRSPKSGFRKYIDTMEYINYTIIHEVTRNADAYHYSMFMHKDRSDIDSLLKFGPIWDFDLSFGNINVQDANQTNGWHYNYYSCFRAYQRNVFKDSAMLHHLSVRWSELRRSVLDKEMLDRRIDSIVDYLGNALARNYVAWPTDGKLVSIWGYSHPAKTYAEDIAMMKSWLSDRIDWIDDNMLDTNIVVHYTGSETRGDENMFGKISVFPNPFTTSFTCSFMLPTVDYFDIKMVDARGVEVYRQTFDNYGVNTIDIVLGKIVPGLYKVLVVASGKVTHSTSVLKR